MNRLTRLLGDDDCTGVVNALASVAAELGITVERLLEAMIEFWLHVPDTVDDHSLAIWASQLAAKLEPGTSLFESHKSALPPRPAAPFSAQGSRVRNGRCPTPAGNPMASAETYTTTRQVIDILTGATALPQIEGETFTTLVKLDHGLLGQNSEEEAVHFTSRSLKELSARVSRRRKQVPSDSGDFTNRVAGQPPLGTLSDGNASGRVRKIGLNRISLLTSADGHFTSFIVLALPGHLIESTRNWLFHEWIPIHDNGSKSDLVPVTFDAEVPKSARGRMNRHWALVRKLCSGVNPDAMINGDYLFARLGLTRRELRPSGAITGRRFNMSQSIAPAALDACRLDGMPILSALSDRAWEALFAGWELAEHDDRKKEYRRRTEQIAEIYASYGQGTGKLEGIALDNQLRSIRARWAWDAHERPHSWPTWW